MSQFFTSGGQSIGVSASTSVLPISFSFSPSNQFQHQSFQSVSASVLPISFSFSPSNQFQHQSFQSVSCDKDQFRAEAVEDQECDSRFLGAMALLTYLSGVFQVYSLFSPGCR